MLFSEEDLLPLSALQHLLFCERQCALIHVEGIWAENRLTVEGQHLHERVDQQEIEVRKDVHIARALPIRSLRLGLSGRTDVVEFHYNGHEGLASVFPIEYKRGKPKQDDSDRVQLCAQAICLEEMLGVSIPTGALFYGRLRHRLDVTFTDALRSVTEHSAARLHELIDVGRTPRATRAPKCDGCSLIELCLPDAMTGGRTASMYADRALANALRMDLPEVSSL